MSQINETVATQVSEVSEKEESVMTKKQIMEALASNGVKFNKKSTKEELEALLESTIQAATESQAAEQTAEEPAEQEAAPEEQAAEPAAEEGSKAEEKKTEEKKAKVVYKNYTSKKNLLKDYPQMETKINQEIIFNHGFTYGVTTGHIAVTYYFSKSNYYQYADVQVDNNMEAIGNKFYQSIKEVKAAIKAQLFPEAGVEVEAPVEEKEVAPATAEEEVATA
jgi:hypothetical protein